MFPMCLVPNILARAFGEGCHRPQSNELFHTPEGKTYASVEVDRFFQSLPIRSPEFRTWLMGQNFRAGRPLSTRELNDYLDALHAEARFSGPCLRVHCRVGFLGDRWRPGQPFFIDLGQQQVVELSAHGWQLVVCPPDVKFRRPSSMRPLPLPQPGGSVEGLRNFINVDDRDWPLVVGWLLMALRPTGPYPLLVLHGEQGSAKSTSQRVLRSLVDPNQAPLRCGPRSERDLMVSASNSWMLAFDNLSMVPVWLSDALCRLATGGGLGTRQLYTDGGEVVFDAMRPMLLTSIDEMELRGDLLERSLRVCLPRIRSDERRLESAFWHDFNAARPQILGALLDGVAHALANFASVDMKELPRMADFAQWATAAESQLGWAPGSFLVTYQQHLNDNNSPALEHPLVSAAVKLLECKGTWEGTTTELLQALATLAGKAATRLNGWPANASALSSALNRLAPSLRHAGISFKRLRSTDSRRVRRLVFRRETPG